MTVENPNVKNTYGGNGVTTVFPFTFLLNAEDVNNVVVTLTNEHGQENATTDFTLSLSDKSVRYPKSGAQPLPHGWKITIQRQIPYTQTLNLTSQGPFFAEDIEAQLDRQEMQIQQLAEIVERTVRVSISSDVAPADLIAKIFQTGVDVSAQLLAAQQSASTAAGSEVNAKNSEAAAREMAEQMNAVLASAADEIKQKLSAEYVPQTQASREHQELRTAISNAGIAILQRSKTYAVGDIAYHKALPSWARLECVKAGTTGAPEPTSLATVTKAGQLIMDGNAVWILDDVRDGARVGDIILRPTLRDGCVKANGATVKASEYPRLLAWVQDSNMTVTAEQYKTDCSKYVYDSAQDRLTLPNMTGRVLMDGETVKSIEAGLPNITGSIHTAYRNISNGEPTGAVARGNTENGSNMGSLGEFWVTYTFDASRANPIYGRSGTVQPPALSLIAQIKY
jgi:hypothetical protein